MASIFQTPVALVTLITEDRVWFKVLTCLPCSALPCHAMPCRPAFVCLERWLLLVAAAVKHAAAHGRIALATACTSVDCKLSMYLAPLVRLLLHLHCLQSKVGPFGACVTREGSWCNYISVPNTPEGEAAGRGKRACRALCGDSCGLQAEGGGLRQPASWHL